jgi:hypothetical protein
VRKTSLRAVIPSPSILPVRKPPSTRPINDQEEE